MKPNAFRGARPCPRRAADSCNTSASRATPAPVKGVLVIIIIFYNSSPFPKSPPRKKLSARC